MNNKIGIMFVLALLLVSVVSATETTLSDDELTMDYTDVQVVTFCIENAQGVPQDVDVVVNPVCKDLNALLGCQPADVMNPVGFAVVPNELTTGADGCADLTLTTTLGEGEEGLFYYTVNGQIGGTTVGSETGSVLVPEFGVVAAIGVLAAAGLFIYNKRK
jgi:hypothetical protein